MCHHELNIFNLQDKNELLTIMNAQRCREEERKGVRSVRVTAQAYVVG